MQHSVRIVANARDLQVVSEIYNPLLIQQIANYQELFRLVFINCQCVGIIKKASNEQCLACGHGLPDDSAVDRWVAPEYFRKEIVSCLEKLLETARINIIAAEIGMISGDWRLIEFHRAPVFWPAADGKVFKFNLISRMIESEKFALKGW